MSVMNKQYSELIQLKTYQERFEYLKLFGKVGEITFGPHREVNQILYQSDIWKKTRRVAIIRDNGFDLAHVDYPIGGSVYVHHINPITVDDILEKRNVVFDLENLVCCGFQTHNAIHYGNSDLLSKDPTIRKPNDTCLWR